jgi:Protein of unknown function (DUF4019)
MSAAGEAKDGTSRRRVAVAMMACVLFAPAAAFAQDPRAATVQQAAREWLALADKLDAAATWKAAGPRFQEAITVAHWAEGLKRQRAPRGAVVQRAVAATTFGASFKGLPPGGNYALVQFRTSFAQMLGGGEHVTLERGADGFWRVIGYVIV